MTTDTPLDAARTTADHLEAIRRRDDDLLAGRIGESWPGERHYVRLARAVIAFGSATRAQVFPVHGETRESVRAAEAKAFEELLDLARTVARAAGTSDPDAVEHPPGCDCASCERERTCVEADDIALVTLLSLVEGEYPGGPVTHDEAESWAPAVRLEVRDWAAAVHLAASDNTVRVPARPAVLEARA